MKKALKSIIKFVAITYFTMYMVATTSLTFPDGYDITKKGIEIYSVNLWMYCYYAVYSVAAVMIIVAIAVGFKKLLKKKKA